jgi:hypothetical protein
MLLACDTTDRLNWGARGASIALQQLLIRYFGELDTLPGVIATKTVCIESLFPASIASPLLARRGRGRFLEAYYRFEAAFGMKADYLELDPAESVKNILKHRRQEGIRDLYDAVASAGEIVVDGDGDLIFRSLPGRIPLFNLALIELASQLGIPVHYVNSIFADCPSTGHNAKFHHYAVSALSKCRTVTLRDPASIRLAQSSAPQLKTVFVPDSLFLWYQALENSEESVPDSANYIIPYSHERPGYYDRIRFDSPYICISGSSGAAWKENAVTAYAALARFIGDRCRMSVVLVPTCEGDRFMYEVAARTSLPLLPPQIPIFMGAAILAKARLYITGRYHPAIMASFGGTPCIFLGSDSHKTASLQEVLEYEEVREFSALPTEAERNQIWQLGEEKIALGNDLRNRIRDVAHRRSREAEGLVAVIRKSPMPGKISSR